jgi:hypothetical protein
MMSDGIDKVSAFKCQYGSAKSELKFEVTKVKVTPLYINCIPLLTPDT